MRFHTDVLSKSEFLRMYSLAESQMPGFLKALEMSPLEEKRVIEARLEAATGNKDFPMLVDYMIIQEVSDPAKLDIAKAYAEENDLKGFIDEISGTAEMTELQHLMAEAYIKRQKKSKNPRNN